MLRYSFRALVGQRSFAAAAVATLALGIAAPTAIFSTVNAVLLEPLPYARAGDIYTVRTYMTNGRFTIGLMASEEMTALQRQTPLIDAIAMSEPQQGATVTTGSDARQVAAFGVSAGFFDLFGLPMAFGRAVEPADAVRGAPLVVVLSHALWEGAYGARPDIVGSVITFMDRPARVIGVAPADFAVPAGADLWTNDYIAAGIGHEYDGYLRLKRGTPIEALQPAMTQAMASLGPKYPDMEINRAYRVTPLLTATVGDLGPILIILFAATALLLVLAAVNVTNLMLARGTARAREIAVRAALGAGRARIVAQFVAESLILAIAGGAIGVAAAFAGVRALLRLGGAHLPRLAALTFDGRVLAFVAAVVLCTGVLVGVVPALRMADADISLLMNESGRGVRGSRRTRRLLASFIAAELAVSVVVVAGASRLTESYEHLAHVDPGFVAAGRLVFDVALPRPQGSFATVQQRALNWWQQSAARLRAAGAAQVAAASSVPLEHEWDSTTFADIVGKQDPTSPNRPNGRRRIITPEFFETAGVRLLAGRPFTDADRSNSRPVAIVSETFVRKFLRDSDPLRGQLQGLRFHTVEGRLVPDNVSIVGVAADVKYAALTGDPEPVVYLPFAQSYVQRTSIVVTTPDGTPENHVADFRRALLDVEPRLAIESTTLSSVVALSIERQRLGMWLMSAFGLAALLLAAVGVFGVIAFSVSQRIGEMAVRQALGATRAQVFWAIVRDAGVTALAGVGAGVLIAWWSGRFVAGYVYAVGAADPAVLLISSLSVSAAALAAMLLPARRAAVLDPARALRQ
ncbi:MAG TPA: ADOP family duplicated permease [Vicinamibacterales bacterium]